MADIKVVESTPCQFDTGWGKCGKPTNNGWCSDHENRVCVSCGKKAIRVCDAQMGGLMCGCPLCDKCGHDYSDSHCKKEIIEEKRKKAHEKAQKMEETLTNPERWINDDGIPATLYDLLKKDYEAEGYVIKEVYYLELAHDLMGFFPAIIPSKREIIFTSDISILELVWNKLPPRKARIGKILGYVNSEIGIVYLKEDKPTNTQEPDRLFDDKRLDELYQDSCVDWANGLISSFSPSKENFLKDLLGQAKNFFPGFKSRMTA